MTERVGRDDAGGGLLGAVEQGQRELPQGVGPLVEGFQGRNGFPGQGLLELFGVFDADHRRVGALGGFDVLAGRLAELFARGTDVEDVIGDLEPQADLQAVLRQGLQRGHP